MYRLFCMFVCWQGCWLNNPLTNNRNDSHTWFSYFSRKLIHDWFCVCSRFFYSFWGTKSLQSYRILCFYHIFLIFLFCYEKHTRIIKPTFEDKFNFDILRYSSHFRSSIFFSLISCAEVSNSLKFNKMEIFHWNQRNSKRETDRPLILLLLRQMLRNRQLSIAKSMIIGKVGKPSRIQTFIQSKIFQQNTNDDDENLRVANTDRLA